MAILCLLLGFLSLVGSSSSVDNATESVTTTLQTHKTDPNMPTNVAVTHSTVTDGITFATTIPSTPAKTNTPIITTLTATTIATTTTAAVTIPSNVAPTGASSNITSPPVTNPSETSSTATEQATTSVTVTKTNQYSANTADITTTQSLSLSNYPKRTYSTEPSKVDNTTKADSESTAPDTVTKMPSTESPHATKTSGPAESPNSKISSSTTASAIPTIMTTKYVTTMFPSSSTSAPTTVAELFTRQGISTQTTTTTTETTGLKKLEPYMKVKCTSTTNHTSLLKVKVKGSANCDDEYATEDIHGIITDICKALKTGYQQNQDKCFIQLERINETHFAITESFIQSHLPPKELYNQLRRNGANLLFSYDGANTDGEDVVSIPLISAIVSLAVLLLIIAAAYGCWHQRKARKREQRLTEELQTMENGYHDNPTLEVMETSPEMQEKKGGPNGELGDSWIVPLDNLTREDLEEEEDTHL